MATASRPRNRDATAAKRLEVVQMRIAGHRLDEIAEATGLAGHSGVRYHLDAWLAEQKPSVEQTEELRQVQAAQIDSLTARLAPMLASEDYLAVVDRIVKLMDRKARLMGLDLERSVQVNLLPTAEQLAQVFGWDQAGVVDVQATELPAADV